MRRRSRYRLTGVVGMVVLAFALAMPSVAEEILTPIQVRWYLAHDDETDDAKITIKKWHDDLKIFVLAKQNTVRVPPTITRQLSLVTGLRIAPVSGQAEANVLIEELTTDIASSEGFEWLYVGAPGYADKMRQVFKDLPVFNKARCAYLTVQEKGYIVRAVVLVPSGQYRDKSDACVARSLFKVLGVQGDALGLDSVLNLQTSELTPSDEAILRLVYSEKFPSDGPLSLLTGE